MVDWFHPGYKAGGPIQSSVNFAHAFKNDFDIAVLTTDTDHGETKPYEGIQPNTWIDNLQPGISIYYAKKSSLSRGQLKMQIIHSNADYVYLNHLFSPYFVLYPLWLKLTGQLKSAIVLCPRGALYNSALSVKKYKKTPVIYLLRLFNLYKKITFHATNERELKAIQYYFPRSKTVVADNLPKTDQPPNLPIVKERGSLKCIFISRIVAIKNLLFFLQALKQTKAKIEFTIIGPVEDNVYWQKCLAVIKSFSDNIRVAYEGPKNNDQLLPYLQKHHLFVLPTTGENFGHSIFEALLSGRPVLISDQTPWLNLSSKKAGWDLSLSDPSNFTNVIQTVAGWSQEEYNDWSKGAWEYARNFIQNTALKQPYFQLFT